MAQKRPSERAAATRSATQIMRMSDQTQKRAALREHFDRFGGSARSGFRACAVRR